MPGERPCENCKTPTTQAIVGGRPYCETCIRAFQLGYRIGVEDEQKKHTDQKR